MKFNNKDDTKETLSYEDILLKLQHALSSDGDFPARTQTVLKVKSMVNNPNTTIDKLAEVILTEISLGTRILHLVNSAYYQGMKKITTISEAIMRIGMHALSDMFSGMVLMQRFVPAAKKGGAFADNITRSILTSLLAAEIAGKKNGSAHSKEQAYLAGSLFHLSFLLLAYYYPHIYESAAQRAKAKNQNVYQSIVELLGITQLDLTLAVLDHLEIPDIYKDGVTMASASFSDGSSLTAADELPFYLRCATLVANAICESNSAAELEKRLLALSTSSDFPIVECKEILRDLPDIFTRHCNVIDMGFMKLPDYIYPANNDSMEVDEKLSAEQKAFQAALNELRQAANDNEPLSSILLLALQTLVNNMPFDRAILFLFDSRKNELVGKSSIGLPHPKPIRDLRISLNDQSDLVLNIAAKSLKPEKSKTGIFSDSAEQVAIPISRSRKLIGMLYAEVVESLDKSDQVDFKLGTSINSLMNQLESALNSNPK